MLANLLEGLFSNLLFWLLFPILGGAVLGFLRRKHPNWASVGLYSVIGAVALFFFLVLLQVRFVFLERPPLTPQNAERVVHGWLDQYGFAVKRIENPNNIFEYAVTMSDGGIVTVLQPKSKDRQLSFHGGLELTPNMGRTFASLTPEQRTQVIQQVKLEMSRAKVTYALNFDGDMPPLGGPGIIFVSTTLISSEYDEQKLMQNLNEIDFALAMAYIDIDQQIGRAVQDNDKHQVAKQP